MTEKPRRKYELDLHFSADDFPYLMNLVNETIEKLCAAHPHSSFSGGYHGSHSATMLIDDTITHDSFAAALDEYLLEVDGKRKMQAAKEASER